MTKKQDPLHSRIPKSDLYDEESRPYYWDFLIGETGRELAPIDAERDVRSLIERIDQVRPNVNSDDHYLFLIWLKDLEDTDFVKRQIQRNSERGVYRSWYLGSLPQKGQGLVIISVVETS